MDLEYPLGGISDGAARTKQPRATSPDAVNVRARDRVEGRLRGGSREGATRVDTLGSSVRQLAVATFDDSPSTFAKLTVPTADWERHTPQQATCRNVAVDVQGNVYALDGNAGVALFNSAGELVLKFALPVKQTDAIVRALCLDDSGAFYVGVSAAGTQADARMWKFRVRSDGSGDPIQEWEVVLGCYVEDMRVRQGVLYVGLNWPDRGMSEIVAYRQIDTSVPSVAWRQSQAPYPLNSLDVRDEDGAIFTAHELNASRAYDLRSPDTEYGAEDATPADFIDDHAEYLWCDLDADDIDGDGSNNSEYANGDSVTLWRDKSGNNRSVYEPEFVGSTLTQHGPPTLDKSKRFGGHDAVNFATVATNYTTAGASGVWQELMSLPNAGTSSNNASSQRTLVPGWSGADWTILIVCRATPSSQVRGVFGQNTSDADDHPQSIHVNSNATQAGGQQNASSGAVCFANNRAGLGTDPGSPTRPYDSTHGWAVIVATSDGAGTGGLVELTVNGSAVDDRSALAAQTATLNTMLGATRTTLSGTTTMSVNSGPFDGQIARVMVFSKVLSATERKKLEGWAMWRYHLASLLPTGHDYYQTPPSKTDLLVVGVSAYGRANLVAPYSMVAKWDLNAGRPRWVVRDDTSGDVGTVAMGGLGYGVRCARDGSGYVYSVGPMSTMAGGTANQQQSYQSVVRAIVDQGYRPVTIDPVVNQPDDRPWEATWGGLDYTYHYPKLGVSGRAANYEDGEGPAYLFVPYHSSATGTQPAAYVYARDGSAFIQTGVDHPEYQTITLSTGARGYACACGPFIPEYEPGQLSQLVDRRVAIGTVEDTTSDECVALVSLVSETRTSEPDPSASYVLGVTTVLERVDGSGPTGSVSVPTTGLAQFAEYESRLWGSVDGTYVVVDARSGIARAWKSKTAGALPEGCRLVSGWGDRIMLSGSPENPFAVTLTGVGNPEDCDLNPLSPNGSEAFLFSAGDAVTALIPMRDDLALIGTMGRLRRMTGNPAAGGVLDDVADVDGVAYGEAWCRDPDGRVFLFHGQGGVSVVADRVRSITDRSIRRRLETITGLVRLAWSWRAGGFHLIEVGSTTAYFFEAETGAWWVDELGFTPTACRAVDGEVWFGCSDGRVLRMDREVDTDDGEPIRWRVVGGPIRSDERSQVKAYRPRFTLSQSGGAVCGLYGGSESEIPTDATSFKETTEGLGPALPIAARGANVWWRLSGTGTFAWEGGSILVEPLGIRRRLV